MSSDKLTLNLSYGSNIWMDQMKRRCPDSRFIGVAKLEKWRWIISTRGYANIVPSEDDHVYGFVYALNERDEKVLDGFEGVPLSYTKHTLPVELTKGVDGHEDYTYTKEGKTLLDVMVYVNTRDIKDGRIQEEYIHRMSQAMADGLKEGIPKEYLDKYLVSFIFAGDGEE
ncbi:hypothetical protein E1B28_009017 [Marasmius oreades]|uniref:gamma-glutamylcyclotransferase n=1 Tax=Marasmius oreades TaxID=181124 RepID=A0A9P7RZL7_9AGAR|nr:uncharacterized protein E1B28_009017 [Marasmius oreades]KAG7092684.1 hypothetical protein E1B28_009017 [Marasmius oreades]